MPPENPSLVEDISEMLMDCDLFRNFPPTEVQSVARYFSVSNAEKDDVIFNEGDEGTFMCIVISGNVSILKTNLDNEVIEIATLHKGRTFGEMAVLDGERRSAMCVAATSCTLLTLSKDSMDRMLQDIPKIAGKVIRAVAVSLSKRLRMADGKLVDRRYNSAY